MFVRNVLLYLGIIKDIILQLKLFILIFRDLLMLKQTMVLNISYLH